METDFAILEGIQKALLDGQELGRAIQKLRVFIHNHPFLRVGSQFEDIVTNYQLMKEYMLKGFKDEQREKLYRNLLCRMVRLVNDIYLRLQIEKGIGTFAQAYNKTDKMNFSFDSITETLEGFVQDIAMLSLEPEDSRGDKQRQIYRTHQHYMENVFESFLVSGQWSDSMVKSATQLLVSPTIDVNDARLLVSALMLSAMNVFDVNKFRTLVNVYLEAVDDVLRQRALVGIVFALPKNDYSLFPQYKEAVSLLCQQEKNCRELLELQMQMFYCMDTDRDNETIQREIIPTLMKNNNFRITRFGIEEKEDDPMDDILHPDAADKAMEELENGIQRMMNMQKAGSDIYFGGFSQMKRFSFFYSISNWFVPFSVEHPELQHVMEKMKGTRFLEILLENGPFCDSDKYSFALAMTSIVDKLPANMKEMLNSQEMVGPAMPIADKNSPAYIRRMYLQDLYRFFRVCMQRTDFHNPFDYVKDVRNFFFANPVFSDTPLRAFAIELDYFLMKRKESRLLDMMLKNYEEHDNADYLLVSAQQALSQSRLEEAGKLFNKVLESQPDDERALKGLAQASFILGDYENARSCYQKLNELKPDSRQYLLNLCISQINVGSPEEGINGLYRLDYEAPDNLNVKRALAWGLLVQHNVEQAERVYDKLLASGKCMAADYLNAGYCKWFAGQLDVAVKYFREYRKGVAEEKDSLSLVEVFKGDAKLLSQYGIGDTDMKVLADIICEEDVEVH